MNNFIGTVTLITAATTLGCVVGLARWLKRRERKGKLFLSFNFQTFKIKGVNMAVTLTTAQQVSGQVNPVDRSGKPAKVEAGSVQYEIVSGTDVAVIEEDPSDETKFTLKALAPGVAELRVYADADLCEGVESIETFAAIEVLPEKAVGFGVTFGTPEDQPTEAGGEG
jgi:hypothetical protein